MNPIRTFIAATLLACVAAHAAESAIDSPLLAWVGKYPSDIPMAHAGPLLQQAALRKTLKTLLPKPEAALLAQFDNEALVRRVDDYLVIDKCRPHACPLDAAMIVIDLTSDRIWAGFFTRKSTGVATRWYGNQDDWNVLPQAIVTDFLKRHGSVAP